MQNVFEKALHKITKALEAESIDYMIVGGFAMSYHNRARTTNDIDLVLQIYPTHVMSILNHFPEWAAFEEPFRSSVNQGMLFNLTDFETGIRYDFITYKDSDYNWNAFQRRVAVDFWGVRCFLCSKEDLVLSKLQWYNITPSEKQLEDLSFLLLDTSLDLDYIKRWVAQLNLKSYGILG